MVFAGLERPPAGQFPKYNADELGGGDLHE
jgi:hypothetical protein